MEILYIFSCRCFEKPVDFSRLIKYYNINSYHHARCCNLNHTDETERRLTDAELLDGFRTGREECFESIASRYLGLISSAAKKYRGMSTDTDDSDLLQEGMVALLSACRTYEGDKGMSFKNYLMRCVENRFRSLLRSATRKGNVPARSMISIEDEQDSAFDPTATSLPELVETKEHIGSLYRILKDSLSDLEYKVAILHLSGYSYKEIAEKLNVSLKTIDNAQTRIRQKLSR